jgi:uncharacterized membrane protein YfcA
MPNIWIILVIIFSSLIKGITGFGFALISFPLLLIWYTPKEIIPVLMICNLVASLLIILQKKRHRLLDKQSYLLMISGGVFTVVGVHVLGSTDGKTPIHLSGIFFIALTLLSLRKNKSHEVKLSNYIYLLAGTLIGFLNGAISISGPPLALFLNRAKVSNRKFREIFAWFSVITASIAIISYSQYGLLTKQTVTTSLLFVPILLVGTIVGKKLNARLSVNRFQTINIVLTIISSVLLIVTS